MRALGLHLLLALGAIGAERRRRVGSQVGPAAALEEQHGEVDFALAAFLEDGDSIVLRVTAGAVSLGEVFLSPTSMMFRNPLNCLRPDT